MRAFSGKASSHIGRRKSTCGLRCWSREWPIQLSRFWINRGARDARIIGGMTVHCVGSDIWPRLQSWHAALPPSGEGADLLMQRAGAGAVLARAQSAASTLLLLVDGSLELSSYRGRERLERGGLAVRPTFDSRAMRAGSGGAAWLQLPWRTDWSLGATHAVEDVDRLLLRATGDLEGALAEVEAIVGATPSRAPLRLHWADDLKDAILADPHLSISHWARAHNVSREGAARAFRAAYAVSPARFRLELRARRAWVRIVSGGDALSLIALETGFADQSHMTRAVGWLTGRSPTAWRRKA